MIRLGREICSNLALAESHEWLVTNGIGGYASGTVAGTLTRRYHGLLIAMFPPPQGRTLLASKLEEQVGYNSHAYRIDSNRWADGTIDPQGFKHVESFYLEGAIPVWQFALADALLEKRIWMRHGSNTTYVRYTLVRASGPVELQVKALVNNRDYHEITKGGFWGMRVEGSDGGLCIRATQSSPPIYIVCREAELRPLHDWHIGFNLMHELNLGVEHLEDHLAVGMLDCTLTPGASLTVVVTAEENTPPDGTVALEEERRRQKELLSLWKSKQKKVASHAPEWMEQLVLAADQFVVTAPLAPDYSAPVIFSGYPWFEEWLRDAMISLEGLLILPGRAEKAKDVLLSCPKYLSDGMLPDSCPVGGDEPEYNNVGGSLYYILAVRAYVAATKDAKFLTLVFPTMEEIIRKYTSGTRHNIHMDPADGLLYAGEPGTHLSWMDAEIDGAPVTPRTGKTVSANALWYNCLCLMAEFAKKLENDSAEYADLAKVVKKSFRRFWSDQHGYCFDVVDGPGGDDASLRPNQLLALSLPFMLLEEEQQKRMLDVCARALLTPYGIRTLSPDHPSYRARFEGTLNERNLAYHQGTSYIWLLAHFAIAHCKVHKNPAIARSYLDEAANAIPSYGVGTLGEMFDSEAPFTPRGCIAEAWSVAEFIRAYHFIETFKA